MASPSTGKAVGILAVVVLVIAVGGAVAFGLGPLGGAGDGGSEEATPSPETPAAGASTDAADAGSGEETAEDRPPFAFEIVEIEECGQTCRDVTATLYNNQERPASNVVVETDIYAGNSTDDGDRVWSGDQDIGDMEADDSETQEQRVELSTREAFSVQRNDGWITVHTTVQSEERTVTFEDRRNVL